MSKLNENGKIKPEKMLKFIHVVKSEKESKTAFFSKRLPALPLMLRLFTYHGK